MADGTAKPVIFICYSQLDEPEQPGPGEVKWRTYVQSHLQPAVKNGIFDLWVDRDIEAGTDWRAEIDRKLNNCDICMLLVSRHALSTNFILDVEVKRILERRESDKLPIFPIVLTPFATATVPWLMAMNLRPHKGKPLSTFALAERDIEMAAIVNEIAELARKIVEDKEEVFPAAGGLLIPATPQKGLIRAETLLVFGDGGTEAIKIDVRRLPETPYENLVGRDDELRRLDDAWADNNTNILSLIAEGGAGKSALVNEWLMRLQVRNYRSAEIVLGWSFYSQGSKERATSADEFLNWALEKLGMKLESASATAKGEAIAEALMQRRILLVLDGVEPLQHGADAQLGQLKDKGLRALLRRFAATPPEPIHGLIVLTSRLAVKDIVRWKNGAAPVVDIKRLSDETGAALLRDNGVWGTDKELKATTKEFGGHPLALGLLASYLEETQTGDVRRRDHIRNLVVDSDNPGHDHARRVMESYEKEWLAERPVLLTIMHMIGLFDRPASADCLLVLRRTPVINDFPDALVDLSDDDWNRAVTRLREMRLLAPADLLVPDAIDAHPLIREWFGERFRETAEGGWRVAHARLYEHLRDKTTEGSAPTLEDLAPLYQAVSHGCCAGWHQEVLDTIYRDRICRRYSSGRLENYSMSALGAIGSDLSLISWFFKKPYETPIETLKKSDQIAVLGAAAFLLSAQGRVGEALKTQRSLVDRVQESYDWKYAGTKQFPYIAQRVESLSFMEMLAGNLAEATASASRAVELADRGNNEFFKLACRATQTLVVLRANGDRQSAKRMFIVIREKFHKLKPHFAPGFLVEPLLDDGEWLEVREWATDRLPRARKLVDIASKTLALGRACYGLALDARVKAKWNPTVYDNARNARTHLDEAIDRLRSAATLKNIARGLLARAAFRRSIGDWHGGARDLDEVEEIAEPGPMRLYLCDMALERARLAFAKIEAFAPLNGMLEKDNPQKPIVPGDEENIELNGEAEKQIRIAADYIEKCSYHLRDEELAELQAVLRGEKKFADLPPRV
jgi:hypothetical protein